MLKSFDGQMLDVTGPEAVQILIRNDGAVIWINTEEDCVFRACQIRKLDIVDERTQDIYVSYNEESDEFVVSYQNGNTALRSTRDTIQEAKGLAFAWRRNESI